MFATALLVLRMQCENKFLANLFTQDWLNGGVD